jgi:LDH2 family malate/lactate/ureidoglycolate dehydrogenase
VSAATHAPPSVTVPSEDLRAFATAVLAAAGAPADDASIMSDVLVWSDLRGTAMQGVMRLPLCVRRMRAGGTRPEARTETRRESSAFIALDGLDSWAPVIGTRAMRTAIAKARATGIGAAVVSDTTFAFALGYYPALAISERMIGLAINDSLPLMAPWGGTKKVLGNQAFAIGAPAGRHSPLLLDTATSAITWTAMHELQEQGRPLPEGVALDADGRPTTDPAAAMAGRLLPLGGPKGTGLAAMWEVLTGVLSGGAVFSTAVRTPNDVDRGQGTSLFMLAIDPVASMPYEQFVDRIDRLIDDIKASPPAEGVDRVYAPGERGYLTAERRSREGIPMTSAVVDELRALGAELGVAWPA